MSNDTVADCQAMCIGLLRPPRHVRQLVEPPMADRMCACGVGRGGRTPLAARPGGRITPLRSSLSKRKPILARSLEPCHAEVRVSCPTRRRAMTAVHSERCCVDIGLARHGSPWTRPASRPETAKSQQLSEIGALLAVHFQHHRRFRHHRRSGSNPWRFSQALCRSSASIALTKVAAGHSSAAAILKIWNNETFRSPRSNLA